MWKFPNSWRILCEIGAVVCFLTCGLADVALECHDWRAEGRPGYANDVHDETDKRSKYSKRTIGPGSSQEKPERHSAEVRLGGPIEYLR